MALLVGQPDNRAAASGAATRGERDIMADPSPWNSLEVAKLIVDGLTPVAVVLLGVWVSRATRRVEASQWVNQKLIEKRIGLLERILPYLNDIFCYYTWIGMWKELSPADIIQRKRDLDRLFFANQPFFSADALSAYQVFTQALFLTYAKPGADAQLRTTEVSPDGSRATSYPGTWKPEWSGMFAQAKDQVLRRTVREKYQFLTTVLGAEIDMSKG
jgi:hypothetical protein